MYVRKSVQGFAHIVVVLVILLVVLVGGYLVFSGVIKLPGVEGPVKDVGWGTHFYEVARDMEIPEEVLSSYLSEEEQKAYLAMISFTPPAGWNKIECEYAIHADPTKSDCSRQVTEYAINVSVNGPALLEALKLTGGTETNLNGKRAVVYDNQAVIYYSDSVIIFVTLNDSQYKGQFNQMLNSFNFQ